LSFQPFIVDTQLNSFGFRQSVIPLGTQANKDRQLGRDS